MRVRKDLVGIMEAGNHFKNEADPKKQRSRINLCSGLLLLIIGGLILVACYDEKTGDFSKPEEFIKNPSVKDAINESGININRGDNPPPLAGVYAASGSVIDASNMLNAFVGSPIGSEFELYEQTASGKISFREKAGGITVFGSGGYITGENGRFTIYLESKQSGSQAGLPDGITVNVVLLMSGTKLNNGNLTAKGLTTFTEVISTNKQYDTKDVLGNWYMWEGNFYLQSGTRSTEISIANENIGQSIIEIIKNAIGKIIVPE